MQSKVHKESKSTLHTVYVYSCDLISTYPFNNMHSEQLQSKIMAARNMHRGRVQWSIGTEDAISVV